jgi:putative MFS transporter
MVVTSTLISEFFPKRNRGRFVAFLESAWAFGWLLAAYIGLILAPSYGWRPAMFAGLTPVITAVLLYIFVPESIRFLKEQGRREDVLHVLTAAGFLNRDFREEPEFEEREYVKRFSLADIWSHRYRRRTLMIWVHWFCIVLTYWGIFL